MAIKKITNRSEKFDQWYTDIVTNAKMAQYIGIKGTMVFEPNSWSIWEKIQSYLNNEFKVLGVKNVSFPMLIPYESIQKEKDHIEGFAPEFFYATKNLEEKDNLAVIRPTSEVLFNEYFSRKVESYKNLPIMYNQWCSVMRAEKNTRPFLRNSEFHWQEGHTCHSNAKEAMDLSLKMIKVYSNLINNFLMIPGIVGKKTESEKFAGAISSYTIESIMQDGQALQCGTSHYFGDKFSKVYNVQFSNENNIKEYAYNTSWGVSTRLIGALIMSHSDDNGLVLPFKVAETQINIIPLLNKKSVLKDEIIKYVDDLKSVLDINGYSSKIDDSDRGMGFKISESEMIGIPFSIVIGDKEIQNETVLFKSRISEQKIEISQKDLLLKIKNESLEFDEQLYKNAQIKQREKIRFANSWKEFVELTNQGKYMIITYYSQSLEKDEKIKKDTGYTPRVIPFEEISNSLDKKCFMDGKLDNLELVIFAKAY